jgi:acyl-CoA reductase-like NAD-dependent aldehyde dehydrogenase
MRAADKAMTSRINASPVLKQLAPATIMKTEDQKLGSSAFAGRRQSGYGIGGIPWTMREMTEQKMIVLRV